VPIGSAPSDRSRWPDGLPCSLPSDTLIMSGAQGAGVCGMPLPLPGSASVCDRSTPPFASLAVGSWLRPHRPTGRPPPWTYATVGSKERAGRDRFLSVSRRLHPNGGLDARMSVCVW
jgi:hypothetical protein